MKSRVVIKLRKMFLLTMIDLLRNMDHTLTTIFLEAGYLMVLKYLENDVQKMIIGEEILTVNIATNSIYLIPLFTLISNKNIVEDPMAKQCLYQLVEEEEADLKKIQIKEQIQEQKIFLKLKKEKGVRQIQFIHLWKYTSQFFT